MMICGRVGYLKQDVMRHFSVMLNRRNISNIFTAICSYIASLF